MAVKGLNVIIIFHERTHHIHVASTSTIINIFMIIYDNQARFILLYVLRAETARMQCWDSEKNKNKIRICILKMRTVSKGITGGG